MGGSDRKKLVRETSSEAAQRRRVMMNALNRLFDDVEREPLPADLKAILDQLDDPPKKPDGA